MINDNEKKDNLIIRLIKRLYKLRIFNPFRRYIDLIKVKIESSIRFEVMLVVGICFILTFICYGFFNNMMSQYKVNSKLKYDTASVESTAKNIVRKIQDNAENLTLENEEFFKEIFQQNNLGENAKAYLTDLDGNIVKKSNNTVEDKVDIFSVMSGVSTLSGNSESGKELKFVYPVTIGTNRCYFIYQNTPKARIVEESYVVKNSFVALLLSLVAFIVLFLAITNNKMKYLDEIGVGLKKIASGNLSYQIQERGNDEIRNIAYNVNHMAKEINRKIIAERRAEKSKADLITNVSHDLRTPLTSIMGYIGLVKDGRYDDDETRDEYLNIAFTKAEKLRVLIEDLFEYTKLNNNGIKITKTPVNITEFLFQLTEELTPLFEENKITVIKNAPADKYIVNLDPDKMLRVFENLLTNAIKYSYKPGNIILSIFESDGYITVAIRNKGKNIPAEKVAKLFERFYRVDESRNEETGGSGLGLAIAKNIVDLHEGNIWGECFGEDISFYVKLKYEK